MFQIGEKVFYPVHGAGVIESIEQREILGEERSYYVLRIPTGDLQVLVPVDTAEQAGLRPVCPQAKLAEVVAVLQAPPPCLEENWNKRYRLHMEKIKSGDICQVAEVVGSLSLRNGEKRLSTGERKLLDTARQSLLSEIILSAGVELEEAERRLKEYLHLAAKE